MLTGAVLQIVEYMNMEFRRDLGWRQKFGNGRYIDSFKTNKREHISKKYKQKRIEERKQEGKGRRGRRKEKERSGKEGRTRTKKMQRTRRINKRDCKGATNEGQERQFVL